jgi:Leucine-rich repeat (LRR) protein
MTEYTYRLTLENLNEPIPIETTSLYCCNLRLVQLPESIGNLINLQTLDCSNNQLTVQGIPEWIGNLSNLRELYCGYNQLQELPKTPVSTCEWIGNLTNLQSLSCRDNQLQELPKTPVTSVAGHSTCESIGNLNNLQYLYCYYNPFKKDFYDIISRYYYINGNYKAQEMLQELRNSYLIPTDNSFILK